MKQKTLTAILLSVLLLSITACSAGFLLGTSDLKGETFTYIMDGNGLDYISLAFNDAGDGGTYESGIYTLGYETAEKAATGNYSDQSWFMTEGQKGNFTYDADNNSITITFTQNYVHKSSTTTYYKADYEWMTLLAIEQLSSSTVTAYSNVMRQDFIPNSDISGIQFFISNEDSFMDI